MPMDPTEMAAAWREQKLRFARFETWELGQLRNQPPDFAAALAWMSEAWELAARSDPRWGSPENAHEHREYLTEIQRRLGRMPV